MGEVSRAEERQVIKYLLSFFFLLKGNVKHDLALLRRASVVGYTFGFEKVNISEKALAVIEVKNEMT